MTTSPSPTSPVQQQTHQSFSALAQPPRAPSAASAASYSSAHTHSQGHHPPPHPQHPGTGPGPGPGPNMNGFTEHARDYADAVTPQPSLPMHGYPSSYHMHQSSGSFSSSNGFPSHPSSPPPLAGYPHGPGTAPLRNGEGMPYQHWPNGGEWQGPQTAGPMSGGAPGMGPRGMPNGDIHVPLMGPPPLPLSALSGPRAGSVDGSRDRRRRDRDRDRDDYEREGRHRGPKDDREGDDEVISTIFVVGFPEDMGEREFQNIFTFARGFEAATLKLPSGSRPREPTTALLAELQHLAQAREHQARYSGADEAQLDAMLPLPPHLEETLASLSLGGTASTSTSTTPSAAMSLTPSAPSGPVLGQYPGGSSGPGGGRRQTIGFARFRTRADALAAREMLQGRKIDQLTGAVLKAEMAKKNLHTRRTTSGEDLVGLLLRSGRLANLVGGLQAQQAQMQVAQARAGNGMVNSQAPVNAHASAVSAREAWDAWGGTQGEGAGAWHGQGQGEVDPDQTITQISPSALGQDEGERTTGSGEAQAPGSSIPIPNGQSRAFGSGSASASTTGAPSSGPGSQAGSAGAYNPLVPTTSHSSNPTAAGAASPPISTRSPSARATDSKALLALAEETDDLDWSIGMGMGMGMGMGGYGGYERRERGSTSGSSSGHGHGHGLGNGLGPLSHASAAVPGMRDYGSPPQMGFERQLPLSPGMGAHVLPHAHGMGAGMDGGDGLSGARGPLGTLSNPADQNPPINTLYVGNLPAISPPTHPPNFLEEALKALFMRSAGYKRMSFRQKINGPMCFVEFEDVNYAAAAIREMYGHTLGGLVKGGIRLSYSKNSLGQRGGSHPPSMAMGMPGMGMGMGMGMGLGSGPGMTINTSLGAHGHHLGGMSPTAHAFIGGIGNANGVGNGLPHGAGNGASSPISPVGPGMGQTFSSLGLSQGVSATASNANGPTSSSAPTGMSGNGASGGTSVIASGGLSPTAAPFTIPTSASAPGGSGGHAHATSPRGRFFSPLPSSNPHAYASATGPGSGGNGAEARSPGLHAVAFGGGAFSPILSERAPAPPASASAAGAGAAPHPIPAPARGANGGSGSTGDSNSGSRSGSTSGSGFSPVSSPIRTPASFSWLSSSGGAPGGLGGMGGLGMGMGMGMGVGSGFSLGGVGKGYEGFGPGPGPGQGQGQGLGQGQGSASGSVGSAAGGPVTGAGAGSLGGVASAWSR